ncbi:3-methylcrotonoyl-CoA carboxylase subunit alpha [Thermogemmatispora aurantia]|uniref:Biotin-dependent 3-methylcrotonyl-coenzyme A carboxylase alpha1 subunit n=1 Tax=Thermogemmatispora aurantia TaxID=2045279 RepID=A0A5J4K2H8_9CHLR|nr:acetyl-CoA carboxylase biotin carboxylase subunit [Thermogemmatispora aurantia]GER83034.1 3-methylcrotonoyl-CoA carboxylase subunit alpha [Thermogemmatispora aurantia]
MFKKILIANRGEIARRIMATCREMGIRTVAVYSEADCQAPHVYEADEAYPIGPAPASESYLRIEAIIAAARQAGAEAIHPGYGFLSENPAFAEACQEAGLVFIGPPASAMRLMGSKIAARQVAQQVGVPTVPGYDGPQQDPQRLLQEAERIGVPLLIKAAAGGGGKGMRVVRSLEDFPAQLEGAQREALAAFGDGTVFLERLLERPRHIEFQILADAYGQVVHLGERECSIQRRHQKIVEESPSPALTPALRARMGEAAVRIARAAGYVNAGTLEFLLDRDQHFYFLEMNTRLQVEHPITELVMGLDLVRQQILIAAGEPLRLRQEELVARGHALEMRLYAEDPEQQFLPSTGRVCRFFAPLRPGVRIDSGVESGSEVSQFYDPMLAKLITYGEDRAASVARMRTLLEELAVFGVKTNSALLHAITENAAFREGLTFTSFLEEQGLLDLGALREQEALPSVLGAAALADVLNERRGERNPWRRLGPWRLGGHGQLLRYLYEGEEHQVCLERLPGSGGSWRIEIDGGEPEEVLPQLAPDGALCLQRGARRERVQFFRLSGETQVMLRGRLYRLLRPQPPAIESSLRGRGQRGGQSLTAPMAGTIVKVQVSEGEPVRQRQVLVILSAMKMEHVIAAPYDGVVRRIYYREGDVVQGGAVVVEVEMGQGEASLATTSEE